MLKKLKNKKGFTLVEMIVVIAIIAILIGLIAPNVVALIRRATRTSHDAAAKNFESAAAAWGTDHYAKNSEFMLKLPVMNGAEETIYYQVKLEQKKLNGTADAKTSFINTTGVDATAWTYDSEVYDLTSSTKEADAKKLSKLVGPDNFDLMEFKKLKKGYTYYLYVTDVGACGGVVITDTNNKVVGKTTILPSGVAAKYEEEFNGATLKSTTP